MAESQAIRENEKIDIADLMNNLAFRAVKFQSDTVLDPNLVEWQVNLVKSKQDEVSVREEIPIKPCTPEDFKKFSPARPDIKLKIKRL